MLHGCCPLIGINPIYESVGDNSVVQPVALTTTWVRDKEESPTLFLSLRGHGFHK
jgi:hypothetical protein